MNKRHLSERLTTTVLFDDCWHSTTALICVHCQVWQVSPSHMYYLLNTNWWLRSGPFPGRNAKRNKLASSFNCKRCGNPMTRPWWMTWRDCRTKKTTAVGEISAVEDRQSKSLETKNSDIKKVLSDCSKVLCSLEWYRNKINKSRMWLHDLLLTWWDLLWLVLLESVTLNNQFEWATMSEGAPHLMMVTVLLSLRWCISCGIW